MAGIYLHIPFCKQACSYCDFYFVTRTTLRPDFVRALIAEIRSWRETAFAESEIETIYLGGGTPSQLTLRELEEIFRALDETFQIRGDEVTMELNPDDVSRSYLQGLRTLGVNRASMGVQSFDEERLRFMNRAHTSSEAHKALGLLASEGFSSYTADLIYGCPGQTDKGLNEDLNQLMQYDPPHLSAYALTIEPRTRLGKQLEMGRLEPADEEQVASQMQYIVDRLRNEGVHRYEVSNFSRPGCEALHNRRYWDHSGYLGMGPSAHSFLWDGEGARRWANSPDLNRYIRSWSGGAVSVSDEPEWLSDLQLAEERLMLGLRTVHGVSLRELEDRYHYPLTLDQLEWIEKMESENLLKKEGEQIRLTDAGIAISDHLVLELLRRFDE
ncbi:MAG: radical SAM family heme chaperone HemW [Balneolaceae bacterium]